MHTLCMGMEFWHGTGVGARERGMKARLRDKAQCRAVYLELAAGGLSMPIGADLILQSKADHERRLTDGRGLGEVVVETARRFETPLAFPLMDLTLEKAWMLGILGVPEKDRSTYHFGECPPAGSLERLRQGLREAPTPRITASCGAIGHVAEAGDLVPVGMAIGPFSLMTKLLSDPITAVYLAGSGVGADEDEEVRTAETALQLGTEVILRSLELQAAAGARAICLCEPAANVVYLSPRQIGSGSDVFERFVMEPNRRIRQRLRELGCDLFFHDCGELSDAMVAQFNTLDPAILSLGSSRKLWLDEPLVSKQTVLFGNLPSKKFYSDTDCPADIIDVWAGELVARMTATGHPFILGTECDVLSVSAARGTILDKVDRMRAFGRRLARR